MNNFNSDITIRAEGKNNHCMYFKGLLEDSIFSKDYKNINQMLKTLKDQVGEEVLNISLTYSSSEGLNESHIYLLHSDFQIDPLEMLSLSESGLDI